MNILEIKQMAGRRKGKDRFQRSRLRMKILEVKEQVKSILTQKEVEKWLQSKKK